MHIKGRRCRQLLTFEFLNVDQDLAMNGGHLHSYHLSVQSVILLFRLYYKMKAMNWNESVTNGRHHRIQS